MQLPPTDELVLVSGLLPIRAKKLRYYEDANFIGRVLPAPQLAKDAYADKPTPRSDDWSGQVRGIDDRLMTSDEDSKSASGSDEGGPQHQRHPGLSEEMSHETNEAAQGDLFQSLDDDTDAVADKKIIDGLTAVTRAYGVDDGIADDRDDIVPGF